MGLSASVVLRETIVNRTYGTHKNLPGICLPFFTHNIWFYLLWSPVTVSGVGSAGCRSYIAGIAGWRIHIGTIERPLLDVVSGAWRLSITAVTVTYET